MIVSGDVGCEVENAKAMLVWSHFLGFCRLCKLVMFKKTFRSPTVTSMRRRQSHMLFARHLFPWYTNGPDKGQTSPWLGS